MSFTGVPYCIQSGDTLWDIARKEMGDPYAWSSIYLFNNLPEVIASGATKITDPDTILADAQLNLPIVQGTVPRPRETVGAQPSGPLKDLVPDIPPVPMSILFKLPDAPLTPIVGPGFTVTLKLKGTVMLTSECAISASAILNGGYTIESRAKASEAIGRLLGKPAFSSDGKGGYSFTNNMIIAAGDGNAPELSVTVGVNTAGKPITKVTLSYPKLTGKVGGYNFLTTSFAIEAEVELKGDGHSTPQGIPLHRIDLPVPDAPAPPAFKVDREIVTKTLTVTAALTICVKVLDIIASGATRMIVPPVLFPEHQLTPTHMDQHMIQ